MINIRYLGLGAAMCCAPFAAVADGSVYVGVGAGVAFWNADTLLDLNEQSVERELFATAMIGTRAGLGSASDDEGFFIAAEAELQRFDNGYNLHPPLPGRGSHRTTLDIKDGPDYRFLAALGYSSQTVDVFGRIGFVRSRSDQDDAVYDDLVWGGGVQSTLAGNLDLRLDLLSREISYESRVWELSLSLVYAVVKY